MNPRINRVLLALGALALAALACITQEMTVVYDADGTGAGTAHLELLYPTNFTDEGASDTSDLLESLTDQGWEDVSIEPHGGTHYRITGLYHFGVEEGDKSLSDVLPGFTLTVEEAENEYRYFTFEGEADFTQLEQFWREAETKWAVEGIRAEDIVLPFVEEGEEEIFSAQEVRRLMDQYGEPRASLRVILPGQTPVDANPFWDNEQAYLAGETDTLEFVWEPGKRSQAPLSAERRLEPLTTVSESQAERQLEELLEDYEQAIPLGSINWTGGLSGHINNRFLTRIFHGGSYTCSDYQGRVLNWLDRIRTSPDDSVRSLLDGLDYGPIQTNGGGHRAVVIYRRGSDWHQTGTVLDPWPRQKPEAYPIDEWDDNLWFVGGATQPAADEDAGDLYPHLAGETSSYPASVVLGGDLARGLAVPSRVVIVRSPVSLMLTVGDGKRLGALPDGTPVSGLGRRADMYSFPNPDVPGGVEWVLFLPESEFHVEVTGADEGEFHVLVATAESAHGFGPQPIGEGETALFSVDAEGAPSEMSLPDGSTVSPMALQPDEIASAMGVEDSTGSSENQEPDREREAGADGVTGSDRGLPSEAVLSMLKWVGGCLWLAGAAVGVSLVIVGVVKFRRRGGDG